MDRCWCRFAKNQIKARVGSRQVFLFKMCPRPYIPRLNSLESDRFEAPDLLKVGFGLNGIKRFVGRQVDSAVRFETANHFLHKRHGVPSFIKIFALRIGIWIEKIEIVDRLVSQAMADPRDRIGVDGQKVGEMVPLKPASKLLKFLARVLNGHQIAIRVGLGKLNRM